MEAAPRPLIGLVAGAAAGLVAAAGIAAIEARAPRRLRQEEGDPAATARDALDPRLGYLVGAVMGGIYGVLSEYRPEAGAGFGGAYAVATAALIDPAAAEPALPPPETGFVAILAGLRALIAGLRG